MSIKPVAWMYQHEETGTIDIVDVQQVEWGFEKNNPRFLKVGPLYAIPDTHRVVSVELLKEAVGQLSELNTFAAIRAIIEDKP